jgi:hypothetical protein
MLGGFQNLFFVFSRDYQNIYVLLSWIVIIGFWATILRWVFCQNGASILIKYKVVLQGNFPSNETMIKIFFVFVVVCALVALVSGIFNDLNHQTLLVKLGVLF